MVTSPCSVLRLVHKACDFNTRKRLQLACDIGPFPGDVIVSPAIEGIVDTLLDAQDSLFLHRFQQTVVTLTKPANTENDPEDPDPDSDEDPPEPWVMYRIYLFVKGSPWTKNKTGGWVLNVPSESDSEEPTAVRYSVVDDVNMVLFFTFTVYSHDIMETTTVPDLEPLLNFRPPVFSVYFWNRCGACGAIANGHVSMCSSEGRRRTQFEHGNARDYEFEILANFRVLLTSQAVSRGLHPFLLRHRPRSLDGSTVHLAIHH